MQPSSLASSEFTDILQSGAVLSSYNKLHQVLGGSLLPREQHQAARREHDRHGEGDVRGCRDHVPGKPGLSSDIFWNFQVSFLRYYFVLNCLGSTQI